MTRISEYQGKPTILLMKDENDKYPFSFGMAKAKLILQNIKDIVEFVKTDGKATISQPLVKNQAVQEDDEFPVEDGTDDIPF